MNHAGESLSIREIARRTGVPESTLRYYRSVFPELIPTVGSGRQRRHPVQAIDVFQRISRMFAAGESRSSVRREIESPSRNSSPDPTPTRDPHADVARAYPVELTQPEGQLERQDLERLLTAMMVRDRELVTMHRELLELLERLIHSLGMLAGARSTEWRHAGRLEPASRSPSGEPRAEAVRAARVAESLGTESLELERLRESLQRERETVERLRQARLELERRLTRLEREEKGREKRRR